MKRHAALQDLSRDHQLMLMQARHIRWLEEGHPRAASLNAVCAGLLAFWQRDGELHLLEEETVLLPALPLPSMQTHVRRVQQDHAAMRQAIAQLHTQIHEKALFDFGRRLHDHVRWEERELFEQSQTQLNDVQLADMGRRSHEFRAQHSRPIGPYGAYCALPETQNNRQPKDSNMIHHGT